MAEILSANSHCNYPFNEPIKIIKGVQGHSPWWGPGATPLACHTCAIQVLFKQSAKPAKLQAQKSKGSINLTLWILDFLKISFFFNFYTQNGQKSLKDVWWDQISSFLRVRLAKMVKKFKIFISAFFTILKLNEN